MTRAITWLCALFLLVAAGACDYSMVKDQPLAPPPGNGGGSDTSASGVTLTVTPPSATVTVGSRFRFIATVTGSANQAVTWQIASGPGAVDQNGYYSAPATIDADTVRAEVRAIAQADSTLSVIARVAVVRVPAGGGGGGGSQEICFERDVLPIFASNCAMRAGCHSRENPQEGFILTSYSGIRTGVVPGDPEGSIIYRLITGQGKDGAADGDDDDVDDGGDDDDDLMPPPPDAPLTAAQIETIRRWIAEGASGEPCDTTGGTDCVTTNVTYSGVVGTILQNNCTGCHSGANPAAGINLSNHAGVQSASANGRLVGSISHAPGFIPMPYSANPADQRKLTDCQIDQIKAWVDQGSPNN